MSGIAARLEDDVGHGFGLLGLLAGVVVGAVIGALIVAATAATGGLALFIIAGAIAGGGLAGRQLARGAQETTKTPDPTTGQLASGSPTVTAGALRSARAGTDVVRNCHGLYGVNHFPYMPRVPIAEGSATVRINSHPAARVGDRLVCGAKIKEGKSTVVIGGPTEQVLPIFDTEEIMASVLQVVGLVSLAGIAVYTFAAGGVVALAKFAGLNVAGMVGFEALGQFGDSLGPGYRDLFQGALGLFLLGRSGRNAQKTISNNNNISASQNGFNKAHELANNQPKNKTVAADGEQTLSGWSPKDGFKSVPTDKVINYSNKIGHELKPAGGLDHGTPGKFNASHAEKQLAVTKPNEPIGVSKSMCSDCKSFFSAHSKATGKPQYVTDPDGTHIFYPNGQTTTTSGPIYMTPSEVLIAPNIIGPTNSKDYR